MDLEAMYEPEHSVDTEQLPDDVAADLVLGNVGSDGLPAGLGPMQPAGVVRGAQ